MKKTAILLAVFTLVFNVNAQIFDWKKAPNSYIYDIDAAKANNYGGIYIPVKKAYEMWASYTYLKTANVSTPIPTGVLSATLLWEDVPGLISNVEMSVNSVPSESKVKVTINESRGKGNAVVAFKVNGEIFWSWHVWVTDNPENGVSYGQGWEKDISNVLFTVKYMDRNLGAVSKSFLGNNWEKSGGLMYEWGRKDPFPPLVFKDGTFFELNGEVGALKHVVIAPNNSIPVVDRQYDDIGSNIRYSVRNPITYIFNKDNTGNWFSKSRYKVAGTNYQTWDLWSDNAKGKDSNGNSSNATLKAESISYELKSELDPCPNGWRIPSYYGRVTQNNNLAFFGRKSSWENDDITNNSKILHNATNPVLNGVKVYPGLGIDFTNAYSGKRNIGIMPLSGGYVYYINPYTPNATVGVGFQDNAATGNLWSATYAYDGARSFTIIADPLTTHTIVGLNNIYNNQTYPTRTGSAARCMKDPNLLKIGNFATEYFVRTGENYFEGLENPNTYIGKSNSEVVIPVNKAFSVYNQYLSDHQTLSPQKLVAKVLWTTNPNLVKTLSIEENSTSMRNSKIKVTLNDNQYGNAVISLHDNDTANPALWSWLVWAPFVDPETNVITYTTEPIKVTNQNFVNATQTMMPPLKTEFMNLNLGAVEPLNNTGNTANNLTSQGLLYQWGRKDPIPTFEKNADLNNKPVFWGSENTSENGILQFTPITEVEYTANYTKSQNDYLSANPNKYNRIRENLSYSVANPAWFLYNDALGAIYNPGAANNDLNKVKDWISEERNQASERWGHADKKSPFDPCPNGWRVPDVSYTHLYTSSKGNSPWYNGYKNDSAGKPGVNQDDWNNVATYYGGQYLTNIGWIFAGVNYIIGNFHMDGIRGEIGGKTLSFDRSGVWTSSLADRATGFALAMQFQGNTVRTGTGVYPQAAMSVRCSRDVPRYLGAATIIAKEKTETKKEISENVSTKSMIEIYPNPFTSVIHLNNENYENYEFYDFSGRVVKSGKVLDLMIETSELAKGIYILKLTLRNGEEFSEKVIKK